MQLLDRAAGDCAPRKVEILHCVQDDICSTVILRGCDCFAVEILGPVPEAQPAGAVATELDFGFRW